MIAAGFDNPLCDAAATGNLKKVIDIVDKNANTGRFGSTKTKLGRAALIRAVTNGRQHIVRELLLRGAEIDCIDSKGKRTPLVLIASLNRLPLMNFLIDLGANIEAQDGEKKRTALAWACSLGNEEMTIMLLRLGANVETRDHKGMTPALLACSSGHIDCLKQLVQIGCDLHARDYRRGLTAIEWGFCNGHENICRFLFHELKISPIQYKLCIEFSVNWKNQNLLEMLIASLCGERNNPIVLRYALDSYGKLVGGFVDESNKLVLSKFKEHALFDPQFFDSVEHKFRIQTENKQNEQLVLTDVKKSYMQGLLLLRGGDDMMNRYLCLFEKIIKEQQGNNNFNNNNNNEEQKENNISFKQYLVAYYLTKNDLFENLPQHIIDRARANFKDDNISNEMIMIEAQAIYWNEYDAKRLFDICVDGKGVDNRIVIELFLDDDKQDDMLTKQKNMLTNKSQRKKLLNSTSLGLISILPKQDIGSVFDNTTVQIFSIEEFTNSCLTLGFMVRARYIYI